MRAGTAEQQQHERKGEEMSVNRGKGQAGRTKESEMGQDVATKVWSGAKSKPKKIKLQTEFKIELIQ